MNGATTRHPASTSAGATLRQPYAVSGKPCRHNAIGASAGPQVKARSCTVGAIACTAIAALAFLVLTVDSHRQFGKLTNAENITPAVTAGAMHQVAAVGGELEVLDVFATPKASLRGCRSDGR